MDIDNLVDLPGQDIVHLLQQVVTRTTPLFDGYFDEPLRNDVQTVVWKFPRSSPIKESVFVPASFGQESPTCPPYPILRPHRSRRRRQRKFAVRSLMEGTWDACNVASLL